MAQKHPAWTRTRVGPKRVRWVAFDDREGGQVVGEGYASTLPGADAEARAALAAAGMYQARRISTAFRSATRPELGKQPRPSRPCGSFGSGRREYLFTRTLGEPEDGVLVAAHLIVRKTAKRIYVTRRSCGPDQIGTEDERWLEDEPTLCLDRSKLERDGSVYSHHLRHSDFYESRAAAQGDSESRSVDAFRRLEIRPPCSIDDIKSAYRRKALEVHPDRGGLPSDFQAVESAYRLLVREAQGMEA